jgi:N-acetylglucosaminyldiphosphoundecaprenol N-acetyl-beta-D-mannosaminyltransferase
MPLPPRVPLLGVGVHPLRWEELLEHVAGALTSGNRLTIAYANVHVLNTSVGDPALRHFLNEADICYCDGNGVRHGARLTGGQLPERMTGADWIWSLAARAEAEGWRICWLGGRPGVSERAAAALRARHPRLQIQTDHGYHPRQGPEDEACLDRIRRGAPHILLVGMGTPEQERWVQERRGRLPELPVVWCLGATADLLSGDVPRPGPRWLIDRHEWLSRLIADPRRLWRRYLLGNALFLARVLAERARAA